MLSLNGIMLVGLLLTTEPQQKYQEAADALYNLDFSIAERGFESLTREFPDNPEYWNARAACIWLKIIHDQEKLNMESFSASDRFGTKRSREALDPLDEKRLRNFLSIAMNKANAILKKNPNDIRALYALGNANATLAAFEATVKRAKFASLGPAKQARKLHERVLQLDPSFHDARLGVGAFDYTVSVIPWLLRKILGISGGNKASGIRELETAAAQGTLATTDARMLLSVVYIREQKYNDALRMLNELHARYPRNFVFELSKASVFEKMKQWDKAIQVYEQVLTKVDAHKDGYDRLREESVYYQLGNMNIHRQQFDKAVDAFGRVVAGKDATLDEKAGAHLWMGKINDSKKDRSKAVQHYDAVLGLKCDPELLDEARRYKRRPFGT